VGLDVTNYMLNDQPSTKKHLRLWGRCFMGVTSSPYQTGKGTGHAKELILGDQTDSKNVFRWQRVNMNLPGALGYGQTMAWVSKVREDGSISA
jgi:hypothetical protein